MYTSNIRKHFVDAIKQNKLNMIQELIEKKDYLNLVLLREMAIDGTVDAKQIDHFFKQTAFEILDRLTEIAQNEFDDKGGHREFKNEGEELEYECELYLTGEVIHSDSAPDDFNGTIDILKFKLLITDQDLIEHVIYEHKANE